tara:strand:- start:116 stop:565 length:450 start_codon:yes stop_codon:yes gene_type:complete
MKLSILVLSLFLSACVADKYEDYKHGTVITTIEYDGKTQSLWCTWKKDETQCPKETLDCVYQYHKEAQDYIESAKNMLQLSRERIPVIGEFYNALCSLHKVNIYLNELKEEKPKDYKILVDAGLVQQTKMVATVLTLKIRELENENKFE